MSRLKSDVSLAVLVIDWDKRTWDLHGMDGCGNDLTLEEAQELFEEGQGPNKEVSVLVHWGDNDQLAVHDTPYSGDFLEDDSDEGEDDVPDNAG